MVKRGHEVEVEYSKKIIIDKINIFFGYNVLEKIKLITFEGEFEKNLKKKIAVDKKYFYINKISILKMIKLKRSLIELNKIFKKK